MARSGYLFSAFLLFALGVVAYVYWFLPRFEREVASHVEDSLKEAGVPYWKVQPSGRDITVLLPPGAPTSAMEDVRRLARAVVGVGKIEVRRYGMSDRTERRPEVGQAAQIEPTRHTASRVPKQRRHAITIGDPAAAGRDPEDSISVRIGEAVPAARTSREQ